MTDDAEAPRPRPGDGDEPLRSVSLDRVGRQAAAGARLASAVRSRALWVGSGCWLAALVVLAVWRGASVGATLALLVGGVAVAVWVTARAATKAVSAVYPRDLRVTIETGGARLRLRTINGAWDAPWEDFRSAERSRGHLLLHRKGAGGAVVLVPALLGPEVFDDLAAAGIPVTGSDE